MENSIKFIREIRILKDDSTPDMMAVKAKGIAQFKKLIAPQLVPRNYETEPKDGIFELDFVLGEAETEFYDIELEVDVVFKVKSIPGWVKGFKINASENSDIELI